MEEKKKQRRRKVQSLYAYNTPYTPVLKKKKGKESIKKERE